MRFDEAGKPGADLPADVVLRTLRELFVDDPLLDLPMAPGNIFELERTGQRASFDGYVYVGADGIQRVVTEFTDTSWGAPVQPFRDEITPVLDLLVALARETDARLFDVADPDQTDLTTARALDLLAPTDLPDLG
ncbi:hypothetical protein GCM10009687_75520 [Asanoa iriomotensis]|uniref:SUKH-4 immunity protein of toxin-antitoxin system n=2 Tax=Asanoa iriomotensis TaxID=234613 RepID=A0ABQ4C859_9ACTN|nr:hypothetical protein Air01nite_50500 [Asanoa iriomotensis]